ncbi:MULTISPECIES: ABC transporter ATP-binding protein [Sorangium]|uniref:MFS transporter n=1 Tax=Sorangium cellulosum TaxID=56 RepID=A0A4P2QU66_SORCE|nr:MULTISPECIES: ABC transporter ATP-binding protein [Sorangium]AUX33666.1 MFS transporter [Sorangium cellulosum]WCQ92977.1 ABC transporter [Sorangium sp. Soce836]
MIEISDLYKYYGDRKAIGPLSFSIEAGEIVGLLGLNGAGKTTTLRILACDLLPSAGRVLVDGLDVVDHPHEVRSRIGYLPDRPPLYDEMSVRAFLHFAARLRGVDAGAADGRVAEALAVTQLEDVAADPISALSHGYKQRVGIAQAIVHKPRLLVLDEPISGLDPVQIVEMRALLRSLRGEHTILLSSHILSEISETCDRILVIRDGEIGAQGTEQELSAKLLHGVRVELTVRGPAAEGAGYRVTRGEAAKALELAREVAGVTSVEQLPTSEPGSDVVSFAVEADRDVRAALCAELVQAGIGILEVKRSERELESVFLRLATRAPQAAKARPAAADAARAGGQANEAPASEQAEEGEGEA